MNPFRAFHDRLLSVWQSVVAIHWDIETQDATADYCAVVEDFFSDREEASLEQLLAHLNETLGRGEMRPPFVSGLMHLRATAQLTGQSAEMERALLAVFPVRPFQEGVDPRWANCISDYVAYRGILRRPPRYRSCFQGGQIDPNFSVLNGILPDTGEVRIGLLGDWGTGEPEAVRVVRAMRSQNIHVLIHLGDIYFSGTPLECTLRFKDIVQQELPSIPTFLLAGNHDYYSGGDGFYDLIDGLNQPAGLQKASFFCLRNNSWQIQAMDTGRNDCKPHRKFGDFFARRPKYMTSLRATELQWHQHQLQQAGARKTILLSHHQLFSPFEKIGPVDKQKKDSINTKLHQSFQASLGNVTAWFWGHEHDFVELEPQHQGLAFGACLGHGAIPVHSWFNHRRRSKFHGHVRSPKHQRLTSENGYFRNGFSILKLDGALGKIQHFEVDGNAHALSLGPEQDLP